MDFAEQLKQIARRIDKEEQLAPLIVKEVEPVGILYDVWLRSVPVVKNKPVVFNVTLAEALQWEDRLYRWHKRKTDYVTVEGTQMLVQYFAEKILKGESIDIFWNPKEIMIGENHEQN